MGIIKNEYKSFLDDIDKNIKNKEDLEYIKARFTKFLDVIVEQIDSIMNYKNDEIEELKATQNNMENKIEKMQQIIDHIEKDIYSEEGFDFEIICPYCNYEFFVDVDEEKTEIECPECHNIIELDWTGDVDDIEDGCSGHCGGCHGCGIGDMEDSEDDEDDM